MRLLVVEDDRALVSALRAGLGAQGFAVDPAGSVAEARALIGANAYDLVVLDLGLPDDDGLAFLGRLREAGRSLPVLVLTARGELEDRVAGLDAGADDYLRKPFAFPELVARIRALLRRPVTARPAVLRVEDLELDPGRLEARRSGKPIGLTPKEFAILEYLMKHEGELVTRSMLLDHCWDDAYDGLSNLVDVHVSHVRRKIHAVEGPALLHTIRGAGFVLGRREA